MIIAFSFLSLLDKDYDEYIKIFNEFDSTNWIHYDVMDGNFVSNKTYDYHLVKDVNKYNKLYSDVHLMINDPQKKIKKYASAGTDQLTFHYESVKEKDIIPIINKIKKYNMKAGISIKPNTDVKVLDKYLELLDYVLIMSVEPGKGGQSFLENSLDKIKYLNKLKKKYKFIIGVDGGINDSNISLVTKLGADVVILGSYLANNLNIETINKLKKA